MFHVIVCHNWVPIRVTALWVNFVVSSDWLSRITHIIYLCLYTIRHRRLSYRYSCISSIRVTQWQSCDARKYLHSFQSTIYILIVPYIIPFFIKLIQSFSIFVKNSIFAYFKNWNLIDHKIAETIQSVFSTWKQWLYSASNNFTAGFSTGKSFRPFYRILRRIRAGNYSTHKPTHY